MANTPSGSRLIAIDLDATIGRATPDIEHERAVAIFDLIEENDFQPVGLAPGQFRLKLSLVDKRLVFDIRDAADAPLHALVLALGPFRRLIKDYHMVVQSHEEAVAGGMNDSAIQAIDMGRRGLHNEGAELLSERLAGRVALDFETARRLFTLVCALHQRI